MIISLEEAKIFMKVDFEDEDDEIQDCIDDAEAYLENATGKKFDSSNRLARRYCKVLANDWYNDRSLREDKKISGKIKFTLQSIMTQLKYGD